MKPTYWTEVFGVVGTAMTIAGLNTVFGALSGILTCVVLLDTIRRRWLTKKNDKPDKEP